MTNKSYKEIEKLIHESGWLEIEDGIYLNTSENLICEQETWHEKDRGRNIDFKKYNYWITDNTGMEPEGFDTVQEVIINFQET